MVLDRQIGRKIVAHLKIDMQERSVLITDVTQITKLDEFKLLEDKSVEGIFRAKEQGDDQKITGENIWNAEIGRTSYIEFPDYAERGMMLRVETKNDGSNGHTCWLVPIGSCYIISDTTGKTLDRF